MEANAHNVSRAFSAQAPVFDHLSEGNQISVYLRGLFRDEVMRQLPAQASILELNCGTGLDAMYFASAGHSVLATDNAPGMLAQLQEKIDRTGASNIRARQCSFHDLNTLPAGAFDHIVSNFGGLNCTENLRDVLLQLAPLLKDNGKITLMIMPKICPWELLLALRGKFRTAFRRLRKNTPAHIEGVHFSCYYYSPRMVKRTLGNSFRTLTLKGVCISVPPEFYAGFAERYPRTFSFLKRTDEMISGVFPFTHCCDHFMITLQKK